MAATQTAGSHTRTHCADCGQTDPDCPTCYGCFLCDSEGRAECTVCGGSGYVGGDSDRYCPACKGWTWTDCPRGHPRPGLVQGLVAAP